MAEREMAMDVLSREAWDCERCWKFANELAEKDAELSRSEAAIGALEQQVTEAVAALEEIAAPYSYFGSPDQMHAANATRMRAVAREALNK